MNQKRILPNIGMFIGLLVLGWLGGLFVFVDSVTSYVEPPINNDLAPTEAIVVLTGGSERLMTGVDLLRAEKGKKLLISGVPQNVKIKRILAHDAVSQELQDCCIILGHAADNTYGNAEETQAFMALERFHTLRLVTAHYHMPRSLFLFRKLMPEVEIVPFPVAPDTVNLSLWWLRPGTASLLAFEYNKYLYARILAALEVF